MFQRETTAGFVPEGYTLAADLANNAARFVFALWDLGRLAAWRCRGVGDETGLAFLRATAEESGKVAD